MKKLLLLLVLTGCAGTYKPETFTYTDPKGELKTITVGQYLNVVAENYGGIINKLLTCVVDAKGDFKTVAPCLKATPAPEAKK